MPRKNPKIRVRDWDEHLPLAALEHSPAATFRAYRTVGRAYAKWCAAPGPGPCKEPPFPASTAQLRAFVEVLQGKGRPWSSLKQAIAALETFARHLSQADPFGPREEKLAWMKALHRKAGPDRHRQAEPLTWERYQQARHYCVTSDARHIPRRRLLMRTCALMGVMRDAMLRRSEAVLLTWEDVVRDGRTGTLHVWRPKTQTESWKFLSEQTMADLDRWHDTFYQGHTRIFGLSGSDAVCTGIASVCEEAGLGKGFTGHSPRVGMAVDLAEAGEGLVAIQQAGDWQNPAMPAYYVRGIAAKASAVARFHRSLTARPLSGAA